MWSEGFLEPESVDLGLSLGTYLGPFLPYSKKDLIKSSP